MTWDGYETVADAVKVLAGEGVPQGSPRGENTGEYLPNGFLARIVVQQLMWIDSNQ